MATDTPTPGRDDPPAPAESAEPSRGPLGAAARERHALNHRAAADDPAAAIGAVDLVLPCLDEEESLPTLLAAVPAGWHVIVVDNGSIDRTADVARAAGATVVTERRRGYGAAVHAGLEATRAPIVAVSDGDGSIAPADLIPLVDAVAVGTTDLACGCRRPVAREAWPWHARLANRFLAAVITARSGVRLHDIAPVRVARRADLLALGIEDRRFGYPLETLLRARGAEWRVDEFDVAYRPRTGGQSKVTGSLRGTTRALRDFSRVLVTVGASGGSRSHPADGVIGAPIDTAPTLDPSESAGACGAGRAGDSLGDMSAKEVASRRPPRRSCWWWPRPRCPRGSRPA